MFKNIFGYVEEHILACRLLTGFGARTIRLFEEYGERFQGPLIGQGPCRTRPSISIRARMPAAGTEAAGAFSGVVAPTPILIPQAVPQAAKAGLKPDPIGVF
jgi:hypothetical protein